MAKQDYTKLIATLVESIGNNGIPDIPKNEISQKCQKPSIYYGSVRDKLNYLLDNDIDNEEKLRELSSSQSHMQYVINKIDNKTTATLKADCIHMMYIAGEEEEAKKLAKEWLCCYKDLIYPKVHNCKTKEEEIEVMKAELERLKDKPTLF